MRIFNFDLNKKQLIIGGVILGAVIGISSLVKHNADVEKQRRIEAAKAEMNQETEQTPEPVPDFHQEMQEELQKEYGIPPEGFEWSVTGELVALGTEDLNPEDIAYTYIRALSILDFSTAQKYSSHSYTIDRYESYYTEITAELTDYYDDFLRKQFKKSLTTIEIEKVTDTAVFADGKEFVTMNLNILDLTDKSFLSDKKLINMFKEMRRLEQEENDKTKKEEMIYNFMYQCYEDGTIGKRNVDVEIVISKENGGGWLVSDDGELADALCYENGTDMAKFILDEYEKWLQKTELAEEQQAIKDEIKRQRQLNKKKQ